jgi:hypothetical protein
MYACVRACAYARARARVGRPYPAGLFSRTRVRPEWSNQSPMVKSNRCLPYPVLSRALRVIPCLCCDCARFPSPFKFPSGSPSPSARGSPRLGLRPRLRGCLSIFAARSRENKPGLACQCPLPPGSTRRHGPEFRAIAKTYNRSTNNSATRMPVHTVTV